MAKHGLALSAVLFLLVLYLGLTIGNYVDQAIGQSSSSIIGFIITGIIVFIGWVYTARSLHLQGAAK